MAKPKDIEVVANAGAVDAVCASQSAGAAGDLLINGSEVTTTTWVADYPRQVDIASAGNDSGITFTIHGRTRSEYEAVEVLQGANAGTVTSKKQFREITKIEVSGATAGTVQVGTNNTVYTPFVAINRWSNLQVGLGVVLSAGATITYTVEHTFDEFTKVEDEYDVFQHETLVSKTVSDDGNYAFGITATRCKFVITSGTAKFKVVQSEN